MKRDMKNALKKALAAALSVGLLAAGYSIPAQAAEKDSALYYSDAARAGGLAETETVYVPAAAAEDPAYTEVSVGAASSSYWGKFESNYYYSQMSAAQKRLWSAAYAECMDLLTGTGTCDSDDGYYFFPFVSYAGLSYEDASNTLILFANSNPEFYFLSNGVAQRSDGCIALTVYSEFASGAARASYTDAFQAKVDTYLAQVKAEKTAYARAKKAHDLLGNALSYDSGVKAHNGNINYAVSRWNQSSAGAFLETETVCAGYAEGLELLLRGAGIPAITVTSDLHEWVEAYIDGALYAIDLTFDDTDYGLIDTFFLVSDSYLQYFDSYHTPQYYYSSVNRPVCVSNYDKSKAGNSESIADSVNAPQNVVRFKNRKTGEHLYTIDADEIRKLKADTVNWELERADAFQVLPWNTTVEGAIQVRRFMNIHTGEFLYSTDAKESADLEKDPDWNGGGVAFCGVSKDKGYVITRVRNVLNNAHVYCTSRAYEVEPLVATGIYEVEGWPFYAVDTPEKEK